MTEDTFATEMRRILLNGFLSRPYWDKRTLILVSKRCYKVFLDLVNRHNEILGLQNFSSAFLAYRGLQVVPARWLSDYEFEIRPPVNFR